MPRPAPSPSPTPSAKHSPGPWVVAKSGVSVDAGAGSMESARIRQERGVVCCAAEARS